LGTYNWWYYEATYQGSSSRPVSAYLNTNWGGYYGGSRAWYNGGLTWRVSSRYSLSGDMTYNDIDVKQGRFITREIGARLAVDFSTRLFSSVFIQYNNKDRQVNTNIRVHFIPRIGSDLYLVYNHLLDEEYDYRTLRNTGIIKLNYTYRL
jgi:hypothetical protein